jgi:hypothetical protein
MLNMRSFWLTRPKHWQSVQKGANALVFRKEKAAHSKNAKRIISACANEKRHDLHYKRGYEVKPGSIMMLLIRLKHTYKPLFETCWHKYEPLWSLPW